MVVGMTPSTVKADFVSAVLSAGCHIELAGGSHYNPTALRSKVAETQANIPAGVGITLNFGKKCVVRASPLKDFVLLPVFRRRRSTRT